MFILDSFTESRIRARIAENGLDSAELMRKMLIFVRAGIHIPDIEEVMLSMDLNSKEVDAFLLKLVLKLGTETEPRT